MQIHLSDDELWRAIADNTNALSALIEQQIDLDAGTGMSDPDGRAQMMLSNVQMIDKYRRDYRQLTAEIRRRHPGI